MDFDFQPKLRGKLLELRGIQAADFEGLFRAASDPLIWEQHPYKDRHTKEGFTRYFDEALGNKALVVKDNATGELIGCTRYYEFSAEQKELVIGYTFLARKYWGGKYNGEMKALMLAHAFKFVRDVFFHVDSKNLRSQKAMAKIGGIHVRTEMKTYPGLAPREMFIFKISRF